MTRAPKSLTLQSLAGPQRVRFTVPAPGPVSVGRSIDSAVCLADPEVSRRHAVLLWRDDQWLLSDLGSTSGSFLNGAKLPPNVPAPVAGGDVLRIGPWVLKVSIGLPEPVVRTVDDSSLSTSRIRRARQTDAPGPADRFLSLLVECIGQLHAADDEPSAARITLASAVRGSGFARGAILGRTPSSGGVHIVAREGFSDAAPDPQFSGTLIEEANRGETVILVSDAPMVPDRTLSAAGRPSAVCVPIRLGGAVVGHLYLESTKPAPGQSLPPPPPGVTAFLESIAAAHALAIANIQRRVLEQNRTHLQNELAAAREVQELLLPPAEGRLGPTSFAVHMRPGTFVAGDLFDMVPMTGGRVAFCLGDVSGHGAGPAMLMATTQAYLRAELTQPGATPEAAVSRVNEYLCECLAGGRFVSVCVCIVRPDGLCAVVDAGHGHILRVQGTSPVPLSLIRGIPLGILPDAEFRAAEFLLAPGDRIVAYSDGVTEQPNPHGEQFGPARLHLALAGSPGPTEDVTRVLSAVSAFAEGVPSADDATVASVRYDGPEAPAPP